MKKQKSERLSVLSDLEEFAFYGFPDFNDEQRSTYFVFEDKEWELISKCPSLHAKVTCAVQIGYFKAKKMFPFRRCEFSDFNIRRYPKRPQFSILQDDRTKIFHNSILPQKMN